MKSMDAEELKKTLDVNERMVREKIQQIRTKKGLSMAEFGKLLGCERQTIFKYEKGLIKTIPLEDCTNRKYSASRPFDTGFPGTYSKSSL